MKGKVRKFVAILLFIFVAIVLSKDLLLKKYMVYYLKKELDTQCSIARVRLSFKSVVIEDIRLRRRDSRLDVGKVILRWGLAGVDSRVRWRVIIEGGEGVIEDLGNLMEDVKERLLPRTPEAQHFSAHHKQMAISFDLKDIHLTVKIRPRIQVDIDFSFQGTADTQRIRGVKDITIRKCNVRLDGTTLEDISLVKRGDKRYILDIPHVRIMSKKQDGLSFPLTINSATFIFPPAHHGILGSRGILEATLQMPRFSALCIYLSLENCSFSQMVGMFISRDELEFSGLFSGDLGFCFEEGALTKIEGTFHNNEGGTIWVKNDKALSFLRKGLSEIHYQTLVDSLKNYRYNRGVITLGESKGAVGVSMNFQSDELGQRNITIRHYIVKGGGK